jgi:alpha-galactosidase
VGFCNFGLDVAELSFKDFDKLGINGKFIVRDLWRQKKINTIESQTGQLSIKVPVHGALLYKFTPEKEK